MNRAANMTWKLLPHTNHGPSDTIASPTATAMLRLEHMPLMGMYVSPLWVLIAVCIEE